MLLAFLSRTSRFRCILQTYLSLCTSRHGIAKCRLQCARIGIIRSKHDRNDRTLDVSRSFSPNDDPPIIDRSPSPSSEQIGALGSFFHGILTHITIQFIVYNIVINSPASLAVISRPSFHNSSRQVNIHYTYLVVLFVRFVHLDLSLRYSNCRLLSPLLPR